MKKNNEEYTETLCCQPPPGNPCCPKVRLNPEDRSITIEDDYGDSILLEKKDLDYLIIQIENSIEDLQ